MNIREAKCGHVLVFEGKLREVVDHFSQFWKDEIQCISHEDQVGIISNLWGTPIVSFDCACRIKEGWKRTKRN